MEIGLLVLRLAVGLTLAAHGAQKLFGWFNGFGLAGTGGYLESIGFRPGKVHAVLAGLGEALGGLLLALGLLTPFGAALVVAVMLVAGTSVHGGSFFAHRNGFEYTFILAAVALALAFAGPGPISLDAALGLRLAGDVWGAAALGGGIAAGLGALATRRLTAPQPQPTVRCWWSTRAAPRSRRPCASSRDPGTRRSSRSCSGVRSASAS
jgi:putative oxidoreductase